MIEVLLADDHGVLRDGVRRLLEATGDIRVAAVVSDGRHAVAESARVKPDVVVMDVSMPGLDGIEATRAIVAHAPMVRVLPGLPAPALPRLAPDRDRARDRPPRRRGPDERRSRGFPRPVAAHGRDLPEPPDAEARDRGFFIAGQVRDPERHHAARVVVMRRAGTVAGKFRRPRS
jgi:CheY-like chemotaxis protein